MPPMSSSLVPKDSLQICSRPAARKSSFWAARSFSSASFLIAVTTYLRSSSL
jgi:hypothetical protein